MFDDLRQIDCHTHVGVDQLFYLRGHSPYGLDYRSLIEQAESHGIGRVLVFRVFPTLDGRGWSCRRRLASMTISPCLMHSRTGGCSRRFIT